MSRDLLIAAFAPAVWGSTYLVTSQLLPPDRPFLAATLRALPIGLLLTLHGRELPRGAWWWRSGVLGTLNIGAFFALLFVAAYRLPGGVAATAGAIQPLIVATLAVAVLGERLRTVVVMAGVLGVVGVGLLVLGPDAELDPLGVAAALAGTVSMASGVVLTKRWTRPAALLTVTGWQLTAGGLVLVPFALVIEGAPPPLDLANVAGYAWLAIAGTGLAYALWFRGIERLPVGAVTFLGLLSPLVATALGWVVLDERLTSPQLGGVALVVAAVALPQLRTTATASAGAGTAADDPSHAPDQLPTTGDPVDIGDPASYLSRPCTTLRWTRSGDASVNAPPRGERSSGPTTERSRTRSRAAMSWSGSSAPPSCRDAPVPRRPSSSSTRNVKVLSATINLPCVTCEVRMMSSSMGDGHAGSATRGRGRIAYGRRDPLGGSAWW